MAGVADLNLRLSFWFLNHKDQLRKWWVIILIVLDVLFVLWWAVVAMVHRTDAGLLRREATTRTGAPLFSASARAELALPLETTSARALPVDAGRVTLAASVDNTNEEFGVVKLSYRFVYGETQLPVRETFLLPKSQRFLEEPNLPRAKGATTPSLELIATQWQRVADPGLLTGLTFVTKDLKFDAQATTTTVPPKPAPRLTATLVNNSVYSFRTADISVGVLDAGGQLVQAGTATLKNWQSFSEQPVSVQWISPLSPNVKIVIVPQVNIFDEAIFVRP